MAARRAGITVLPRRPRLTPGLRRLAIIAAPAALAGGVVQINLLVGRQVASFTEGAIAWLNYADRLYQLPLGVVGIAIGVVLLPDLSRKLAADDRQGGIDTINRAAEFTLALTLPAAAALIAIPGTLIGVLFERGAFTAEDTAATALALAIYGLGLPAFVLQKVLQPVFFARENTRSPFRYALVAMVVNLVLAVGLAPLIGYVAAPIATTLSAWAMLAQLWIGARAIDGAIQPDARLMRRMAGIAGASVVMGVVVFVGARLLAAPLEMAGLRIAVLAALVAAGAAVYAAALIASRTFTPAEMRGYLRRR